MLLVRIEGGPEDRLDRVLARQFSDPESFLQFVALLLALAGAEGAVDAETLLDGYRDSLGTWGAGGQGLLEVLLRSLSRSPHSIDDVARLVDRLRATNSGREVLPSGWNRLWDAVLDARSRVKEEG